MKGGRKKREKEKEKRERKAYLDPNSILHKDSVLKDV